MIRGITVSCFDLLHPGHILMLEECKKYCDYLIVGLQTDPTLDRPEKNKPIQTMYERWLQLRSVKWIDDIIPYDTEKDLVNLLLTQKYDYRFLGSDWQGKPFTGHDIPGMMEKCIFLTRNHNFSSSELRNRIRS